VLPCVQQCDASTWYYLRLHGGHASHPSIMQLLWWATCWTGQAGPLPHRPCACSCWWPLRAAVQEQVAAGQHSGVSSSLEAFLFLQRVAPCHLLTVTLTHPSSCLQENTHLDKVVTVGPALLFHGLYARLHGGALVAKGIGLQPALTKVSAGALPGFMPGDTSVALAPAAAAGFGVLNAAASCPCVVFQLRRRKAA